ncbi:SDR family NAD(P)-dependent oxidoreductase [Novosphingobium cyanobacteriorum]|uniref:SDR family NAD(P)-dependent oxidoreductase n=1 Tax=Novosphingobium cyanobacteriorum TaxID=3024215 RepID=A0ABT6CFD9_9SPHN|nr:SDR family NAD(P)-dependent oxidoreductase [Novosphingobium cyanobacteriorum]MDF8332198.1 SDR family NAD(P)-dependent oxidoreductase [Novosphingobium cyanobacteriorum]
MALTFAREGARVAVIDKNGAAVAAVAAEIREAGGEAQDICADLSDRSAIPEMVAAAAAALGGLDIVVNNAGLAQPVAIDDPSYLQVWDRLIKVMLDAPAMIVHAAIAHLRKSDAPRILNIASTEGLGATAFGSPYSAAKAGVIGLTRSLAVELGKEGITVNCICPGPIDTGIVADVSMADREIFARRRTALRRYGRPEEIAEIALSFCSPAASYLTGAIVPVDGGLTARNA